MTYITDIQNKAIKRILNHDLTLTLKFFFLFKTLDNGFEGLFKKTDTVLPFHCQ